jgi:pilus assembly protein FimV
VALNLPTQAASASAAAASDAAAAASAPTEAASAAPADGASTAQAAASTARPAASDTDTGGLGLLDRLMAALANLGTNPWPLAVGSALIAGLAAVTGLFWWSRRKPKGPTLAGAAGRTASKPTGDARPARSMAGSSAPAQLPSVSVESQSPSDGDPLAEADVYLSYGRDLQAEEILEEALRTTPNRLPIITKLLEVYARRFDWDAFEPLARRARTLTGAQGPDWARVVALGASLAPVGHPLFGADASDRDADATDLEAAFGAASPASSTRAFVREASPGSAAPAAPTATPAGLDLDIEGFRMPAPTPDAPAAIAAAQDPELDSLFEDDLGPARGANLASPTPPGAPMEFDLAGLSLDLNPPAAGTGAGAGADADALATKLSLAEEFLSIGDTEGARSLAEEVRAQASGDLRARAERLLSELG